MSTANYTPAMFEIKKFGELRNSGATKSELVKAAMAMKDSDNRKVCLLHLGVMTKADKREIAARWKSIRAVTKKEMAAHCQFDGIPAL